MKEIGTSSRAQEYTLKRVGKIFALVFSVGLLLLLSLISIGYLTNQSLIKQFAENRISDLTNAQQVELGDVSLSFSSSMQPIVAVTSAKIMNFFGQSELELLDIQIELELLAALFGEFKSSSTQVNLAKLTSNVPQDGTIESSNSNLFGVPDIFSFFGLLATDSLQTFKVNQLQAEINFQNTSKTLFLNNGKFTSNNSSDGFNAQTLVSLGSSPDTSTVMIANLNISSDLSQSYLNIEFQEVNFHQFSSFWTLPSWLNELDLTFNVQLKIFSENGTLNQIQWNTSSSSDTKVISNTQSNIEAVSASGVYLPDTKRLGIDDLHISSTAGHVSGSGYLDFSSDVEENHLITGRLDFQELQPKGWKWIPKGISSYSGNIDFQGNLKTNHIDIAQLILRSEELSMNAKGQIYHSNSGWNSVLEFEVDDFEHSELIRMWPNLGERTRNWFSNNLTSGQVTSSSGGIRILPTQETEVLVNFQFDNVTIEFIEGFPPITKAGGFGFLENESLSLQFESGIIEDQNGHKVDATGSHILVQGFGQSQPRMSARLVIEGKVEPLFELLNHSPLNLFARTDIPIDIPEGSIFAFGEFDFPIIRNLDLEDIQMSVKAKARDVKIKSFQGGYFFSDQVDIEANQDRMIFRAEGQFQNVPITATWEYKFDDEAVILPINGTISLSPEVVEKIDFLNPYLNLSETHAANFDLHFSNQKSPTFSLTIELPKDNLLIPVLSDGSGEENVSIKIEGSLGSPVKLSQISLTGKDFELQGMASIGNSGSIENAKFDLLKAEDWLDVNFSYEKDGEYAAKLQGGSINLVKAPRSRLEQNNFGKLIKPVEISLDEVELLPGASLTSLNGLVNIDEGIHGEFTAKINQQVDVRLKARLDDTGSSILINSADAGSVLRSAGILNNLYGGMLAARISSISKEEGHLVRMKVTNVRAQQLTALGEILSIASIIGMLEQLNGSGIQFADVQAEIMINDGLIEIKRAFASGPSIGMTLKGTIDRNHNILDLKGEITPLNFANEFLIMTPLQVLGISKGDGFGAISYFIRGPIDKPVKGANPLSVLTPGVFKTIFE